MLKLGIKFLIISFAMTATSLVFAEELFLTLLILVTIAVGTVSLILGWNSEREPARLSNPDASATLSGEFRAQTDQESTL